MKSGIEAAKSWTKPFEKAAKTLGDFFSVRVKVGSSVKKSALTADFSENGFEGKAQLCHSNPGASCLRTEGEKSDEAFGVGLGVFVFSKKWSLREKLSLAKPIDNNLLIHFGNDWV